jgi:uncharacterized surface protein with fasciclin (FAS1) repeats
MARNLTFLLAFASTSLFLAAQSDEQKTGDKKTAPSIVQIASEAGQFNTLVAAVKAAGLADTLSGKGPFTVFAPTDAAFAKLGKDAIADLLKPENKAKLAAILTYHVVGEQLPAAKVVAQKQLTSLQGGALAVEATAAKVTVGGANVSKTDIVGSNGVIHVIDTVLLPPAQPNLVEVATKAGSFGTLLKAAVAAGLAETLANDGPFTIFAPTDAAFAKLGDDALADLLLPANKAKLVAILKHHVVAGKVMSTTAVKLTEAGSIGGTKLKLAFDGKVLRVGGANVIKADVEAGNGVIHVVDSVILPQ